MKAGESIQDQTRYPAFSFNLGLLRRQTQTRQQILVARVVSKLRKERIADDQHADRLRAIGLFQFSDGPVRIPEPEADPARLPSRETSR